MNENFMKLNDKYIKRLLESVKMVYDDSLTVDIG